MEPKELDTAVQDTPQVQEFGHGHVMV